MYIVIMAGGSGTRFWPISRKRHPKQFLQIAGDKPMLDQALENAVGQRELSQVIVVAGESHRSNIVSILPELPDDNLLCEPVGRNTAPAIGFACIEVARRDPQATLAVLPSDHVIEKKAEFQSVLEAANRAAQGGDIVTIGITPTRPETGYGYIRLGDKLPGADVGQHPVFQVLDFVEKPNLELAKEYIQAKNYLWNAGMFVFRVDVMLKAIERWMPDLAAGLDQIASKLGTPDAAQTIAEIYPKLPSESIDFGVMEKVERVAVVPADIGWSDVGSWSALEEVIPTDKEGNVGLGDALLLETQGSVVDARQSRVVAVLGCKDLVVVDSEDAVLVLPKDRAQDVKKVLAALKQQGREELL